MLTRALIVLLVVLNLGVAAWWIWRPEPAARALEDDLPTGIARLRLLQEAETGPAGARRVEPPRDDAAGSAAVPETTAPAMAQEPVPAPPPDTAPPVTDPSGALASAAETPPVTEPAAGAPPPARCYRIGPYPDELARTAALPALRPYAGTMRSSETRAAAGRGWRVIVPPAADADAAKAMAERIRAAGFTDYFVVGEGADANAIALGRFSSEDRARQHAATLAAAGFPARAESLGDTRPQYWVDIVALAEAQPAAIRRAAGGPDVRPGACPAPR